MPRRSFQQRLPFPTPPGLACPAGAEEPALWIRRVVLWKDVSKAPIQNVKLERGLNIIWSPTGPEALATGHAAGKTLFCRLLRYCLGEESFADPDDTAAIRARFPGGAVGAEIRLQGTTWAVRRGFGIPRDDRATKAETVDQLADDGLRNSFGTFRSEIENTIFDDDQRSLLAEMEDVQGAWQYVLAWLTRDQECRIDGLTHWRHPDSSSHSPVRSAGVETRLNVLRVAVGLYSKAASAARRDVASAARRADSARRLARQAQARFDALQDELATALGIETERVWPPPVELLQEAQAAADAHLRTLMTLADQSIRTTGAVSMTPTQVRDEEQLELAAGDLARMTQQIANLAGEVERGRERVKLLEGESSARWGDVREAKHPVCPYDSTPLDVDKAKFACPLPRLPDPAATERIAAETEANLLKARSDLREVEGTLTSVTGEKASLEARAAGLRRKVEAHQLTVAAATHASQAAWATKGLVLRLFELHAHAGAALSADTKAKDELGLFQARQLASLSAFSTTKLERWFDFLIRRVVAPEAAGTIVLDGNGLHPRIEWRGTRRSVALNSLQIVLFDLAAMLCAVEGDTRVPAFLVHDSPREGDLDPWTYARIFEALFELGPDESTASFQYIVTTTTDPPEGRVRARVRLQIAADTDDRRLFQVDL